MKRRIFNAGVLVSLVLTALVIIFWIRSHRSEDGGGWGYRGAHLRAYSVRGRVALSGGWTKPPIREAPWTVDSSFGRPLTAIVLGEGGVLGFRFLGRYNAPSGPVRATHFYAVVPYWALMLLGGVSPTAWAILRLRRSRRDTCPACGYDLRGNLSGAGCECPECGAEREAKV